ncbi:SYG1 Protein SYG1 [Candida maltosa Xu316]
MKFEESLNEGLVPEWQDQYVNYKQGKKLIKKIKKLKEEYEFDEFNTKFNSFNTNSDTNTGQTTTNSKRRQSFLNFSTRSLNDKKDDFLKGKENFIKWLEEELVKVDDFYIEREQDVYERFLLLEDQLYQLRDQKTQLAREKNDHDMRKNNPRLSNTDNVVHKVNDFAYHTKSALSGLNRFELPSLPSMRFLKKLRSKKKKQTPVEDEISLQIQDSVDLNYAENRVRNGIVDISDALGPKSEDQTSLETETETEIEPDAPTPKLTQEQIKQTKRRDYVVQKQHFGVSYVFAKKQLKNALLEHYRALSLLKSFRTLNRTAFRKITKKYDKSMGTKIMEPFLKKIDNSAYFVTSDLLDKLILQVEELYIAFFDPSSNDRKHSLEKLKTIAYAINVSEMRPPTFYRDFFVSGIFLGFGLPLFVLALYTALHKVLTGEMAEAKFLLQIWAGFFLLDFMFVLFTVNLAIFKKFKINYKFIFEFDIATALDYKQFLVLPAFGFALFALLAWFSFNDFWPQIFPGRDWPWLYFGIMLAIFLWPGDVLYGASRRWLQVAVWRLILSGFYPVEFRDFFLGDIISSLTYTMGNISFFFCLYSNHWNGTLNDQPESKNTCGSSKSRSMGFFSTLPSIWRFLQCIRRFMDTGDWFPHLANAMKYTISAVYYITLSVYRIDRRPQNKAVFIVFAFINSVYCSIWDIVMDWSLLQSDSKHYLLRDHLFYKKPVYYYVAMVTDVVLRFQWVFYAFFNQQIQQSAVTSYFVALAEIFRRFIWLSIRMENEHATNVFLFRASKDTPLPYAVSNKVEKAVKKLVELRYYSKYPVDDQEQAIEEINERTGAYTSGRRVSRDEEASIAISRMTMNSEMTSPKKSTFKSFSDKLNRAHIKDFQRRKTGVRVEEDSDDEDDEDDDDASLPPLRKTPTRGSSRLVSLREENHETD